MVKKKLSLTLKNIFLDFQGSFVPCFRDNDFISSSHFMKLSLERELSPEKDLGSQQVPITLSKKSIITIKTK